MRARNTVAMPSSKEVEERNLDHAVFWSWRPRCVKGRAESYGHKKGGGGEGEVPTVGVDYMCMRSEQEKRRRRACR